MNSIILVSLPIPVPAHLRVHLSNNTWPLHIWMSESGFVNIVFYDYLNCVFLSFFIIHATNAANFSTVGSMKIFWCLVLILPFWIKSFSCSFLSIFSFHSYSWDACYGNLEIWIHPLQVLAAPTCLKACPEPSHLSSNSSPQAFLTAFPRWQHLWRLCQMCSQSSSCPKMLS